MGCGKASLNIVATTTDNKHQSSGKPESKHQSDNLLASSVEKQMPGPGDRSSPRVVSMSHQIAAKRDGGQRDIDSKSKEAAASLITDIDCESQEDQEEQKGLKQETEKPEKKLYLRRHFGTLEK